VNIYTKIAQSVLRLLAFALVMTSAFLYSSDIYLLMAHRRPSKPGVLALKGLPLLLGLVFFWKSREWAEQLTKDLD
jgi:hypothetical protein